MSKTLSRLYRGARRTVVDASLDTDPAPFREVASTLDDIAGAWAGVRNQH